MKHYITEDDTLTCEEEIARLRDALQIEAKHCEDLHAQVAGLEERCRVVKEALNFGTLCDVSGCHNRATWFDHDDGDTGCWSEYCDVHVPIRTVQGRYLLHEYNWAPGYRWALSLLSQPSVVDGAGYTAETSKQLWGPAMAKLRGGVAGENCVCGHHANDHTNPDGHRTTCGGGLSESCSCRQFHASQEAREEAEVRYEKLRSAIWACENDEVDAVKKMVRTLAAEEYGRGVVNRMPWTEHLELLEEAMKEMDETDTTHGRSMPVPDALADAFCIAEGVVGEWWEAVGGRGKQGG